MAGLNRKRNAEDPELTLEQCIDLEEQKAEEELKKLQSGSIISSRKESQRSQSSKISSRSHPGSQKHTSRSKSEIPNSGGESGDEFSAKKGSKGSFFRFNVSMRGISRKSPVSTNTWNVNGNTRPQIYD